MPYKDKSKRPSKRTYNKVCDGKVFGHLTVIKQVQRPDDKPCQKRYWLCKCECGNDKILNTANLISGTKSCGCLKQQVMSDYFKGNNPGKKLAFGEANFNHIFRRYKRNALKTHLEFNLSSVEFRSLVTSNCYYCNCKPAQVHTQMESNGPFIYNGIDRKDNMLGYTVKNAVACCAMCNFSKRHHSEEDFKTWIVKVYNHSIKDNV